MKTDQSLNELTPDATISQIITADKQAGELLASIGLSLSKHENDTLRSVCKQRQWSEKEVLEWVKKHSSSVKNGTASNTESKSDNGPALKEWTEHLEETFIRSNLSLLNEVNKSFPRVQKVHGNQYPWLKNMQYHFNNFEEALTLYYNFERSKVFPLANRIKNGRKGSVNHGAIQKLQKSFAIIEEDQNRLQRLMKTIRQKGKQFENPDSACSTLRIQNENFKALFSNLDKQFETENKQFIPRVKEEIKAKRIN